MKNFRFIVILLMVIGSLNWGLVGLFNFDLISAIFRGPTHVVARVIFALVGIAGLFGIKALCCCKSSCKCGPNCNCGPNCGCCKK
ncbi:MAG TPA: DUF378 domain-containing protein [Chlamydiales bacterium]|nr:DUF378 domain-containing protein [Chlamydiales bacterium]